MKLDFVIVRLRKHAEKYPSAGMSKDIQAVLTEIERLQEIAAAAWGMRREAASYNSCPDLGLRVLHRDRLYGLLDQWKAAEEEKKEEEEVHVVFDLDPDFARPDFVPDPDLIRPDEFGEMAFPEPEEGE